MSSAADARLAAGRRLLRTPSLPASLNGPRALGTRFGPLVQAARLDDLLMLVVRFAEEIAQAGGGFVALVEPRTHEVDLSSARDARGLTVRPADLHPLFAGEGVLPRLGHGVHVQQTAPSGVITVLLPLVHNSRLQAILGVDLPGPARPLGRAVEPLRDLCQQSAPLVARLREIADLQALVAGLTTLVQDGAQYEARARDVEDDRRGARYESAFKTHLIASVNHALRTPLVSLRGYARLLLDENVTPEQQRQYVDVLARNAERLVEVAANLLGAPRVKPSLAPTDARAWWSAALAETRTAAAARGVTLVEHVPEEPVSLVADETLLRRMLSELLAGTLEVTPRGEELRAEMLDESRRIVVTITAGRDAGPAPNETGRRAEGSPGRSLRLDTVRELANLHGGGFVVLRENARQRAYSVVLPRVSFEE